MRPTPLGLVATVLISCASGLAQVGGVSARHSAEVRAEIVELELAIRSGQLETLKVACERLIQAVTLFDPTVDDFHYAVLEALEGGKPESAAALADAAVHRFGTESGKAYLVRALVAMHTGETRLMWSDLEAGLRLAPESSESIHEFWVELVDKPRLHGIREGLPERYRQFNSILCAVELEGQPDSAELQLFLGLSYAGVKRLNDARLHLRRAIEVDREGRLPYHRHQEIVEIIKGGSQLRGAEEFYSELFAKNGSVVLALVLAQIRIELGDIENAMAALQAASRNPEVDERRLRRVLGNLFDDAAEKCREPGAMPRAVLTQTLSGCGADEIGRVLGELPPHASSDERLGLTFDLGRMQCEAGRLELGTQTLVEAHDLWRTTRADAPLPVLFQLGKAWLRRADWKRAEAYFREFHRHVEDGGAQDAETLEYLGDIYLERREFGRAREVLTLAVVAVENARDGEERADGARTKLARALLFDERDPDPQGAIVVLRDVRSRAVDVRLLLAHAELENGAFEHALHLLRSIQSEQSPDATDAGARAAWMGQGRELLARALHAQGMHGDALALLEELCEENGRQARHDLRRLRAQVLFARGELDAAEQDYRYVAAAEPHDTVAWNGLGDLVLRRAEAGALDARLALVREAIEHYKRANAPVEVERANGVLAQAQLRLDARRSTRIKLAATVLGLVVLAGLAVAARLWVRRRRAALLLGEVVELEAWLRDLLRARIGSVWDGDFTRLSRYAQRFNYKAHCARVERGEYRDVLDPASFGELVALCELGWRDLNLADVATDNSKRLVLAHLRYVADCRAALAHLTEIQDSDGSATRQFSRQSRAATHMTKHVQQAIKYVKRHLLAHRAERVQADASKLANAGEDLPVALADPMTARLAD